MKVLKKNSKGPDVKRWQVFLTGQGFSPGIADGKFGDDTHDATASFQRKHKLLDDGVVGNDTVAVAMQLGFPIIIDKDDAQSGPNFPSKPNFPPLTSTADRQKLFGKFNFIHVPVPGNKENIDILGDWEQKNIIKVKIPQFAGIQGASVDGTIRFHRLAAPQLVDMCAEWETEGLSQRILSYAGSFVPRFIRGSNKVLSNHAFGTAFDINVPFNMLGATPALLNKKGCVRELVAIAHKHGFYWGGHFKRLDGMHFEVAKLK